MLTKEEVLILNAMKIDRKNNNDVEEIVNFEKKFNKNSLEILNQKEDMTSELLKWKLLVEKVIYFNIDCSKFNKINEVTYLTYSKKLLKKEFPSYLNEVTRYKKFNPNIIFILSNSDSFYKRILGGLNERGITTLFITDNVEDLNLEYSNTIIKYNKNPKNELIKYKPKVIEFVYENEKF